MREVSAVLLLAFMVPALPAGRSGCSAAAPEFRKIIEEFQSRQQNVGLSATVMADGRVVYEEAFGWADKEAGVRATSSTAFGIASITKAFTGSALLKLHEAGKIDLDAEIQRYVPEFPRHPQGAVTIRELAAHLGGIRHWGPERNDALYARHFDDVAEILPLFKEDAFAVPPGTKYNYSSYGYNLIALAIERASGVRYQDYVSREIIRPLRLTSVAFDRPGFGGKARPARYSWYDLKDFHELTGQPVRVPDWDYSHNMAAGNLVATSGDLARFGLAFRTPGLLSAPSLRLVWTRPVIAGVESTMSFGWYVRADPERLGIGGSNAGLQAGVTVWRDAGLSVAVVANTWGVGSRSGELMDDSPRGLLGKLAAVCGPGK